MKAADTWSFQMTICHENLANPQICDCHLSTRNPLFIIILFITFNIILFCFSQINQDFNQVGKVLLIFRLMNSIWSFLDPTLGDSTAVSLGRIWSVHKASFLRVSFLHLGRGDISGSNPTGLWAFMAIMGIKFKLRTCQTVMCLIKVKYCYNSQRKSLLHNIATSVITMSSQQDIIDHDYPLLHTGNLTC